MSSEGRNHFEHMVARNQWSKIAGKISRANVQTKLDIAEACSKSSEDESMNILTRLLTDSEEAVQLQAVKSLGIIGRSSTKTHLHWLSENLPEGRENVKQAIKEALASISSRN
jgi:HEAT repeat protein